MIYFMQPVGGGPVKIGASKDVKRRLKQLQGEFGVFFVVLAVMDGDFQDEGAIHDRFAHLRFKGTEQFQPAADLMEFIGVPFVDCGMVEALPKRGGTLIRVSDETFEAIRDLAGIEKMSIADVLDQECLEFTRQYYRDKVCALARTFEGKG